MLKAAGWIAIIIAVIVVGMSGINRYLNGQEEAANMSAASQFDANAQHALHESIQNDEFTSVATFDHGLLAGAVFLVGGVALLGAARKARTA